MRCLGFLHSGCDIEPPVCAASSQPLYRRRIKHGSTSRPIHFVRLKRYVIKRDWANFRAGSRVFVPPLHRSCPTVRQRSLFCVSELSHEVEPVSFVSVPCQASHRLLCRCLHALNHPSLLYHNPWASSTASGSSLGKFRCRLEFGSC